MIKNENNKNILIAVFLSDFRNYDREELFKFFKDININTLGDLVNYPYSKLEEELKKIYPQNVANHFLKSIKKNIHGYNMTILDEFSEIKLLVKDALISIDELPLSTRVLNLLKRRDIYYLGDLLELTIPALMEIRNLGKETKTEIVNTVYHMGYKFRDDENSYLEYLTHEEFIEAIKNRGETLLSEVGFSEALVNKLNSDNIYSVEVLLNFGLETIAYYVLSSADTTVLNELVNKKTSQEEINEISHMYDVRLKLINQHLEEENQEIKKRIMKKQQLLKEYQDLLKEKNQLLEEDSLLDEKINQIKKSLNKNLN